MKAILLLLLAIPAIGLDFFNQAIESLTIEISSVPVISTVTPQEPGIVSDPKAPQKPPLNERRPKQIAVSRTVSVVLAGAE